MADPWDGDGSHDYEKNWIGDHKPNYDLLYRPDPWKHYPNRYVNPTETNFVYYPITYFKLIPHTTRWSRMLVEIEEHWDAIAGYQHEMPISGANETKIRYTYTQGVTNYANSKDIVWSSIT